MPIVVHQVSQPSKRFVPLGGTIRVRDSVILPDMGKVKYGKHFIRQWREHRGLSLRQLESRLEFEPGGEPLVSYVSLGRIERFEQPYSQPILEAVAAALNCTTSDLLQVDPTKPAEVVDITRFRPTLKLLQDLPADKLAEAERYLRYLAS